MSANRVPGNTLKDVASTSGRYLEGVLVKSSRSGCFLSNTQTDLRKGRAAASNRTLKCDALAFASGLQWPLLQGLVNVTKRYRERHTETLLVVPTTGSASEESQNTPQFVGVLKQATVAAVQIGLKLTGIAILLAKTLVLQTVKLVQIQQKLQKDAEEAKLALKAQALKQIVKQREILSLQGKDTAFMEMLQNLDRAHIDHDVKWALVQKHTADKADFSERLKQLFEAAMLSKAAVETLLRPDASRAEINQFWKSTQTAELIADEESLKSLVFAQMLQA